MVIDSDSVNAQSVLHLLIPVVPGTVLVVLGIWYSNSPFQGQVLGDGGTCGSALARELLTSPWSGAYLNSDSNGFFTA